MYSLKKISKQCEKEEAFDFGGCMLFIRELAVSHAGSLRTQRNRFHHIMHVLDAVKGDDLRKNRFYKYRLVTIRDVFESDSKTKINKRPQRGNNHSIRSTTYTIKPSEKRKTRRRCMQLGDNPLEF